MLYEFAIEPALLASWDKCRGVLNLMGFRYARVIAAYPTKKRWKKLVFEACQRHGCKEREFQRIVAKIQTSDHSMVRSGQRPYSDLIVPESERWFRNAVAQQMSHDPFHAILAKQDSPGEPSIVLDEDIDASHPRLDVRSSQDVLRQPGEMAAHVRALVRESRKLLLIDPHFDPDEYRWRPVVSALLALAAEKSDVLERVEIHALDTDAKCAFGEFAERCRRRLPAMCPRNLPSLRVVRWRIRVDVAGDFHARYILTERGGYKVDKGLDEEHGKAQDLSLMEEAKRVEIWAAYQDPSPVFEKDDELSLTP